MLVVNVVRPLYVPLTSFLCGECCKSTPLDLINIECILPLIPIFKNVTVFHARLAKMRNAPFQAHFC